MQTTFVMIGALKVKSCESNKTADQPAHLVWIHCLDSITILAKSNILASLLAESACLDLSLWQTLNIGYFMTQLK